MYLRIVRPLPPTLEGFDVTRFQLQGGYDVYPPLCDLLVLEGYAVPEEPPPSSREAAIRAIAGALVADIANPTDLVEKDKEIPTGAPRAPRKPRRRR